MTITGIGAAMGAMAILPTPARIPFSAVDRYARRYGIAGAAFDLLLALITKLDEAYLAWDGERQRERFAAISKE